MLFGDTVCEHEGSVPLLFLNLPGAGVWPLLCPCSPNILGLAMLAWCALSSVWEGGGLWRLTGRCPP